ncbi:MAG: hypothetical protein OJF59_002475 [Cytophagales bacterium]|jgi:hypothetical protein|nr:hypothetical protein [Bacteroidota bacterium]MBS1980203.1 hypothetical protein [Bacteroidota bacterium]WHZ08721.1 MAG: hypothetical protein OJF59_002475 [Cytophagales bacterium]
MKYTFILLNMVSCLIVRAQADFVVPFKGDTLTGEAKILSFDKIDRVQITSHGKKTIFQSTQVRSLRMNQDLYRAVRYENSIRMMKIVKDGYLSLLAFNPEGQSNSSWSGQYLLKRDGQGVEVPNLSFKKILSNFLGDCPDIKDHFQKGDFSKHDLNRIVDLYNTCLDVKTKNLNGQPKTVEISTDKVLAVKQFIEKVQKENFVGKKDVLDLLTDIQTKVMKGETIPNYMGEGLKPYLKEKPDLEKSAEELLSLLKNK